MSSTTLGSGLSRLLGGEALEEGRRDEAPKVSVQSRQLLDASNHNLSAFQTPSFLIADRALRQQWASAPTNRSGCHRTCGPWHRNLFMSKLVGSELRFRSKTDRGKTEVIQYVIPIGHSSRRSRRSGQSGPKRTINLLSSFVVLPTAV